MKFGKYGRNAGWQVIGILAVIYGVGLALFGSSLGQYQDIFATTGAIILGLLFLAFMVLPFILWLRRPHAER